MDTKENTTKDIVAKAPVAGQPAVMGAPRPFGRDTRGPRGEGRPKNPRKGGGRPERVKSEFDQKILNIRRVTRVASGGRRFSFSVAIVIGNRNGSVGVGLGKAGDTSLAIDKAVRDAKKNMITLTLTKEGTIPHDMRAKYGSARVMLMPALGRGIVAGSAARTVVEFGGMKDVAAKVLSGSKNQLNIARATMEALRPIAKRRMYLSK